MSSGRAARNAAQPDIQKWLWTAAGGSFAHPAWRTRANSSMCGQSSSFGIGAAGPASTWRTITPGAKCDSSGSVGSSRSRVHDDVDAQAGQSAGQLRDVDVLAARVDAAEQRHRTGVFGHHVDPHVVTSSSSWFQSDRKRSRP